jgi:hypothetical protein
MKGASMQVNARTVGAGVAAAIAAGLGYALLFHSDDEVDFDTILREGAYSVRSYPQLTVAETITPGMRGSALALGLAALADYCDGKLRGGRRIGMTMPVFADGDDDGRGWRTRLVMPAGETPATLPAPDEPVHVRTLASRRLAALRFSGEADDGTLARRETDLRYWMETHGLRAAGPVEHGFYAAPFLPGPLRRSEVLIPLA